MVDLLMSTVCARRLVVGRSGSYKKVTRHQSKYYYECKDEGIQTTNQLKQVADIILL